MDKWFLPFSRMSFCFSLSFSHRAAAFSLTQIHLLIVAFVFLVNDIKSLKTPMKPISWHASLVFSLAYFMNLGPTSKIHFQLNYMNDGK